MQMPLQYSVLLEYLQMFSYSWTNLFEQVFLENEKLQIW